MKSDYEERQEARRERYEDLADKNAHEGTATLEHARTLAELIPFGQPILVGHHSEKRDRGFRNRIHNKFDRGLEALDKSKYYADKAASVGKGGISSDDPNAIGKLREKLTSLEALQEQYKEINATHKKFLKDPDSLNKSSLPDSLKDTIRNYTPRYSCEPHPIPPYKLRNNGAEIRRIKDRIKHLEQQDRYAEAMRRENAHGEAIKAEDVAGGLRIEENADENRVFLFFPSKPSDTIRKLCKRSGFRWAPSVGAWSRHLSTVAVWAANEIKTAWLKEQEPNSEEHKASADHAC